MLAAAWGSSLGPDWSVSWMQWGAFGLVAAFGLSIGDRIRTAQHHRAAEREATHRIEQRLDVVDRFEHNARPLTASMP